MIILTRPDGERFALNPDLVSHVADSGRTRVVLVDGASFAVAESLEDVVERMYDYRAAIVSGGQLRPTPHLRLLRQEPSR